MTIESTCDETAAAVIDLERRVLGSVVASQTDLHEQYGGVVPELASRAHVERILPVIQECLTQSTCQPSDLVAIAVANRPGLAGSLIVGLAAAKALCLAWNLPLITINHLQGHIYAGRVAAGKEIFPCVGLVVSGGHTSLYRCRDALDFELLGGTIDDAAGESFDKVAAMLGLPYPGGPHLEQAAKAGSTTAFDFPRPLLHEARLAFSFSGLKTAVRYALAPQGSQLPTPPLDPQLVANIAASFQQSVADCLIGKSLQALKQTKLKRLCMAGGVAANRTIRDQLATACAKRGVELIVPPPALCTDNAILGAIAIERYLANSFDSLDVDICPGLER